MGGVARGAAGHDAASADLLDLPGLERLDHASLGRHAPDPAVGLDAHVFCTTILGNFEVMSRCDSAIFTAQRPAIRREISAPRAPRSRTPPGFPGAAPPRNPPSRRPRP